MRVHLVDGTFELYRAHFSQRPDRTATLDGKVTTVKATVGLMASMLALLAEKDEQCTHLAVAFDNPIASFRNDMFDGYKSDEGVPDVLHAQFDLAEEAIRALGIVVWSMDRWEADDALATGAARYKNQVDQVRIMTPDKDLGQCVEGAHVIQIDRMRKKLIDEAKVREIRGVAPKSIPDLLGLVGDTSDGIPGIPGFGAKSAAAVLARWETIEAIPDDPSKWDVKVTGAPRLAANLAAQRDDALLYKKLATLIHDVPTITESLADLEHRGVPRALYSAFSTKLALNDTTLRVTRWS